MKKKISLQLLILAVAIIATSCTLYYYWSFHCTFGAKQELPANNQRIKLLDQEENDLWQKLQATFGISRQDVAQTAKIYRRPQQAGVPLSQNYVRLITDIMQEFNVNPTSIQLYSVNKGNSPAYAGSNSICINAPLFDEMPPTVQRFIVAHELQHIINHDIEEFAAIQQRALQKGIHQEGQSLLDAYSRFQEKRADLQAAQKNTVWAHAYADFAQEGIKRVGTRTDAQHPSYQERLALANNVINNVTTHTT